MIAVRPVGEVVDNLSAEVSGLGHRAQGLGVLYLQRASAYHLPNIFTYILIKTMVTSTRGPMFELYLQLSSR